MKETIKKAIEATADKRGTLTPDRVVEAASSTSSPLHNLFEWDDAIAAHQHRLDTARELIRAIRYVVIDDEGVATSSIAYVHHPGSKEQAYTPLSRAAKNKKLAVEIIEAEIARCEGAIGRAREVAGVLGLTGELDDLLRNLIIIRKRAKAHVVEDRASV